MFEVVAPVVRIRWMFVLAICLSLAVTAAPLDAENTYYLAVSPDSLTFDYVIGGTVPATQAVAIVSAIGNHCDEICDFTLSSPGSWVTFSPASGTAPKTVHVGVAVTGLSPGTYTSKLIVSSYLAYNAPLDVPIVLNVKPAPLPPPTGTLSLSPASLTFNYLSGAQQPGSQSISLTSSLPLAFNASKSQSWITLNPLNGSTPASLTVGVNPSGLSPGTYSGSVTVTSGGASNSPQNVPVTLIVQSYSPPEGTLSLSPASLTFNYLSGAQQPGSQSIAVTSSLPLAFDASTSQSWITLNPPEGTTPASLSVGVNPYGLGPGTHTGSVTVRSGGASNSPQTVAVTLIVESAISDILSSVPSSLRFDTTYGAPGPPSQTLTVSGNVALNFTLSKSAPWITLSATSGLTQAAIQVGVNANALIPGTYYGFVTIEGAARNSPLTVQLVLNVSPQPPALVVSPKILNFKHASGTVQPPLPQSLSVLGSVPTSFTAVASDSWVKLSLSQGTTPASIQVGVDPTGLAIGTHSATITVSGGSSIEDETVVVVLEVMPTPLPQLSADPSPLIFTYVIGSGQPPSQVLNISGSQPVSFSAATPAAFVSLSATSGLTNAAITVRINPAGLIEGRYDTSVTISATAANSPLTVPVVLYVTSTPPTILRATPALLTFNYVIGGTPPQARSLSVSGSSALNFTASSSAVWAAVNPTSGSTPASLQVSVAPAGLNPGIYFATLTVQSPSAINNPQSVVVVLNVFGPPSQGLSVSPSTLRFNYVLGSPLPPKQAILISSAIPSGFTASASTSWVTLDKSGGNTPDYLGVGINPSGLAAGVYNAKVTIAGTNTQDADVILTVTTTAAPTLTVTPPVLTFIYLTGLPVPSPQAVSVDGPGLGFTASFSASWLKLDRTGGIAPTNVNVSVDPRGLNQGVYNTAITFVASGSNVEQTVHVRLLVDPSFSVDPRVLLFNHSIGSTPPAAQTLFISGTSQLKVTRFVSEKWIVTADSGQNVAVSVDPTGLPVGVYNGTIVIDAEGTLETPYVVLVTLVVNPRPTTLTVGPPLLEFRYVLGSALPASQMITVDTVGHEPIAFSAGSNAAWIVPDLPVGLSPAFAQVFVDPTGLKAGVYEGLVEIRAPGVQQAPQKVTIRLSVLASPPAITVTPATLTFVHTLNTPGSAPAPQTLLLTSNAGLSFADITTTSWLSLSTTAGSTTGSIAVSVNPQGLGEGTYTGAVEIQSGTSVQSIPVTLIVRTSVPEFRLTPHLLVFEHSAGSALPPPAKLSFAAIAPTSAVLSVATVSGGNWITLSSTNVTTPGSVEIGVNPSGLTEGVYFGTVNVVAPSAPNGTRSVAVVLIVRATNDLAVSSAELEFTQYIGGPKPPAQQLIIQSGLPTAFRAQLLTPSGSPWLSLTSATRQTPATVDVSVNGAGLKQGIHHGHIVVTGTTATNVRSVHVSLAMKNANLAVAPALLDFEYQVGGPIPLPQTVSVAAPVPATFTISSSSAGNWLSGTLTGVGAAIRVNPVGLQPGIYQGTIVISAPALNAMQGVAVRLKVTTPGVTVSPTSLVFEYFVGSALPAATQVSVTNAAATAFSAAPSTASGGNWLRVNPASETTPAAVSVSVDPTNIIVGTYTGSIVFQSGGAAGGTTTLPVELRVRSITLTAVGVPDTASPTQQLPFELRAAAPASQSISGSLVLMFSPNVATPCLGACDEMLQFATGGRTLGFSIPANQTSATFTVPSPAILIGTTAGTVTLVAQIQNGPAIPVKTMTINRAAPRVVQLDVVRNTGGFEVRVTGYSTSRAITSVVFRFEQRAGGVLQTTEIPVTPSLFDAWFRSAESGPLGGQFRYVQPFAITGDPNAIGSVSVILGNDQGTTTSNSVAFPQQ